MYVDDIILTGNDVEEMKMIKLKLAKEFKIKDSSSLRCFLGIEVARSKKGIYVSQWKYILNLLNKVGMLGCKLETTSINPNRNLGANPLGTPVDKGRYQRLVRKLIYLSYTWPEIAYVVGLVSQFMHAPMKCHMKTVTYILRYLKHTPRKGLLFEKHEHCSVETYIDVDWGGLFTDGRSTSCYCTLVAWNLVTWRSKKLQVVSCSSAEAEFKHLALRICELTWLNTLLKELHVKVDELMRLYRDNKATISIAHNPVQHKAYWDWSTLHQGEDRRRGDLHTVCSLQVTTGRCVH